MRVAPKKHSTDPIVPINGTLTSAENAEKGNLEPFFIKNLRASAFFRVLFQKSQVVKKNSLVFFVILVINLLLVAPKLMPVFSEINPDDEAKYVESGRFLLDAQPRDLAWAPLVAVVYAPIHLLVGNSRDWFMLETWIGRFILYVFLWVSMYTLAIQFKNQASPLIMMGILFVMTVFFPVLENQSDALFITFSVLGLAKFLAYYHDRKLRDLGIASVFIGFGILCRVETIVLIGIITILAIIYRRQALIKTIAVAILPALCPVVLFFAFSFLTVGNWNLGIGYKSYEAFEMNQPHSAGGNSEDARQETRRLFGTEADNNGSVLRAIMRNPPAFMARILTNAKAVPVSFLNFFGKRLAPFIVFFAVWGIYTLIKRRNIAFLIIPLFWACHVVIALGFFTRHIIPQMSYLPLLYASIGIASAFDTALHGGERVILVLAPILCGLFSWVDHKPAFILGFVLIAVIVILVLIFRDQLKSNQGLLLTSALLLLSAGLILREPYSYLDFPVIGRSIDEHAVHYLEEAFPENTQILTSFTLPAIASKMISVNVNSVPPEISTAEELYRWLSQNDISAIYVDERYMAGSEIPDLMEAGLKQYFAIGYKSSDNLLIVYRVKPN